MRKRTNKFNKALKHIKSTKIDDKLSMLEAAPTNNTSGLYARVIGTTTITVPDPDNDTPDYSTIDFDIDGEDGKDTSGLFDSEGNSLFVAPPGDNSYILGPMASMYYGWSSNSPTRIGYIRESDRRMVNLASLSVKLNEWDGDASKFNSYGQLTLEQALWFRDIGKKDGDTGHIGNYRAFYPGPPTNAADSFGRYLAIIVGIPLATIQNFITKIRNDFAKLPIDKEDLANFAAMLYRLNKREYDKLASNSGQVNYDLYNWYVKTYGAGAAGWYLNNPSLPSHRNPFLPGGAPVPKASLPGGGYDVATAPSGPNTPLPAPGWGKKGNFTPKPMWQKPKPTGGSGRWGTSIKLAHHQPTGKVLSESRKIEILKNIKKPVVVRETKQKKYKVSPGKRFLEKRAKTNFQGMDKLVGDAKPQKSFKKPDNIWSTGWQKYNAKLSQGKKNIVLEKIGEGKDAWNYMLNHGAAMDAKNLEEFWGKNPDFYSYFFNGKKYRPIRKEQVKGDYIVFLVDEFGANSNMLQSELNAKLAEEDDKKLLVEYEKLHGKFYNKLDPISANSMPPTGDPEIDAKVNKQKTKSKTKLYDRLKVKIKKDLTNK